MLFRSSPVLLGIPCPACHRDRFYAGDEPRSFFGKIIMSKSSKTLQIESFGDAKNLVGIGIPTFDKRIVTLRLSTIVALEVQDDEENCKSSFTIVTENVTYTWKFDDEVGGGCAFCEMEDALEDYEVSLLNS